MRTDRELLQEAYKIIIDITHTNSFRELKEEILVRLANIKIEPRAWVASGSSDGKKDALYFNSRDAEEDGYAFIEPLYSYIRQPMRLSDEEICEIAGTSRAVEGKAMLPVTFARAIEKAIWEKNK